MRFLICLMLFFLLACAKTPSRAASAPPEAFVSESSRAQFQREISYSASLSLTVTGVEGINERTKTLVEEMGGWIADSSVSERRYSASIRVPADKLQATIEGLSSLGEVKTSRLSAEDVTDVILDVESQLKNLKALRERYRLLLAKSSDVKDLLVVEQELNRVEGEIERLEARRHTYERQVKYSTLEFSAEESTIYGPLGLLLHGSWWVLSKLFVLK